jgi:hypothetical protein
LQHLEAVTVEEALEYLLEFDMRRPAYERMEFDIPAKLSHALEKAGVKLNIQLQSDKRRPELPKEETAERTRLLEP